MHVIFLHGPPASGKYTIGVRLSELTRLPLFHNHLAVDAATSLFPFGTPSFNRLRAAIWQAAFDEAARSRQSFIFTFNPESTVDPGLIPRLCGSIES
ncbi:MAG TPA: shikimate kinase, partial [Thermoanaerobaculia bacterium]|nr:shikimate kinase [Thermoanaerobaculia bacterium]